MTRLWTTILATIAALLLVLALIGPAAAARFYGTGVYARFGPSTGTDVRGLVIGDRLGGDQPRLSFGLVGLLASEEYFIAGRSIGCNGTPSAANRVFRISVTSNADGTAFGRRDLAVGNSYSNLRSIWIDLGFPGGQVCQVTFTITNSSLNVAGDWDGDGALGLTKVGAGTLVLLLEKRPNNEARLSIVWHGLDGNDQVSIRLVNKACGKDGAQALVSYKLENVMISSFRSRTVALTQNQLDSLRSMRVRLDNGPVTCAPLAIIAILTA